MGERRKVGEGRERAKGIGREKEARKDGSDGAGNLCVDGGGRAASHSPELLDKTICLCVDAKPLAVEEDLCGLGDLGGRDVSELLGAEGAKEILDLGSDLLADVPDRDVGHQGEVLYDPDHCTWG